jgi:hypothetical protein
MIRSLHPASCILSWSLVIRPTEMQQSPMGSDYRKIWLPLGVLAVALLLWAGMFATGAYLQLGADAPRHDFRKPLIIMGSMAVFLSLWGLALWARARR